jgi:hypothetical protein
MHGLETPPKDPRGTVTTVIAVVLGVYLLAVAFWNLWDLFK